MLGFWLLVVLIILFIGSLPTYNYSRSWGYWPGGLFLALLLFWLVLIYIGTVAFWWPWATPVVAG
jgi:Protein of unknown function (DUF3309)